MYIFCITDALYWARELGWVSMTLWWITRILIETQCLVQTEGIITFQGKACNRKQLKVKTICKLNSTVAHRMYHTNLASTNLLHVCRNFFFIFCTETQSNSLPANGGSTLEYIVQVRCDLCVQCMILLTVYCAIKIYQCTPTCNIFNVDLYTIFSTGEVYKWTVGMYR